MVAHPDGTGSNLVLAEIAGLKVKSSISNLPSQDSSFQQFDAIANKKVSCSLIYLA